MCDTDNGSIYAAGLNDHGQLGVSDGIDYTIVRDLNVSCNIGRGLVIEYHLFIGFLTFFPHGSLS